MRILPLALIALAVAGCDRPDRQALPTSASTPSGPAAPAQPARAEPPPRQTANIPPPEATSDRAITGKIELALAADPRMAGADVSVHTDSGVVALSGTVRSHEQAGVASAHAQRQDGVLRVDNHLRPALS